MATETYKLASIYIDGVKLENAEVGIDFAVGESENVRREEDPEEIRFLALAMFRRRMRPEAAKLSEENVSDERDDRWSGDRTDEILKLMWERASHISKVWQCSSCALKMPPEDLRWNGDDPAPRKPTHGILCGPVFALPEHPKLRKVRDECEAEAALVVRECSDLTLDDYPACLNAWEEDDEYDNVSDGDGGEVTIGGVSAPKQQAIVLSGLQATDKLPGAYLEISFAAGPTPPKPQEAAYDKYARVSRGQYDVKLDRPLDGFIRDLQGSVELEPATRILRTQEAIDELYGTGSGLAIFLGKQLARGPIYVDDPVLKSPPGGVRIVDGKPIKGIDHDDRVDALLHAFGSAKTSELQHPDHPNATRTRRSPSAPPASTTSESARGS